MTKKQHFYSLLATMMAAYTPNNANAEQRYINCQENDMIFMKASRGLKLERILDCFTK